MSYLLAFEKTGDIIPFETVNREVLDFYIWQLDQQGLNSFGARNKSFAQSLLFRLTGLKEVIQEVNSWLYDLIDIKFDEYEIEGYLDQRVLNKIHADWVRSQSLIYDIQAKRKQSNFSGVAERLHDMFPDDIQHPPLGTVLHKLNLHSVYDRINDHHVHGLESMFNEIRFSVSDSFVIICENPFDKKCLTNDMANISLSFNHLGRTLYEKWLMFDRDLEFADENSYDQLLGYVSLHLVPAQTLPMSREYVEWCVSRGRQPIGNKLNIGNIPDLNDNLSKYRTIVYRNLLHGNRFTIQTTRG